MSISKEFRHGSDGAKIVVSEPAVLTREPSGSADEPSDAMSREFEKKAHK
jgi:hypothetical protein